MKYLQNLHTHTLYSDGRDTAEEMALGALEQGFDSVGFSDHSPLLDRRWAMKVDRLEDYCREIDALKEKYAGRLDVYRGLETEMLAEEMGAPARFEGYDYQIGSCHFLRIGNVFEQCDCSQQNAQELIDTYFGGDGLRYAKAYYEHIARLPEYGDFDVVGHIDVITKHEEKVRLFDTETDEYRECVENALKALRGKIRFFEVNTGAIVRGYRTTPYPAPFITRTFKALGFEPVITSDCHDHTKLGGARNVAEKMLTDCGFTHHYVLTKNGFVPIPLGQEEA